MTTKPNPRGQATPHQANANKHPQNESRKPAMARMSNNQKDTKGIQHMHPIDEARDSEHYVKDFGPRLLALAADQLSHLCGDKAPTAENIIQHAQTLALLGVAQSLDDTGERIGGAVGDLSNAVFGLGR